MEDFLIIIVIKFLSIFFIKVCWLVAFQSVIDSGQVLLHYFVEILSKLVPNFLPRILLVSSWKGDFTSCSCSSLLRKRTLVQILWSRSYQRISNAQRQCSDTSATLLVAILVNSNYLALLSDGSNTLLGLSCQSHCRWKATAVKMENMLWRKCGCQN